MRPLWRLYLKVGRISEGKKEERNMRALTRRAVTLGSAAACTIDKFEFRTQGRTSNTVSILAGMCGSRPQPVGAMA